MTTRQFKIYGEADADSTGTININGVEVFNGTFVEKDFFIVEGSVDIDDALAVDDKISVPTTIVCNSGKISVGLSTWNYGWITNPAYTSEQINELKNPSTTKAAKNTIWSAVANPPLSDADKILLASTDPLDLADKNQILYDHNLTTLVQSTSTFVCGVLPDLASCNRLNVLVDGNTIPGSNTNNLLDLLGGQTMTLNNIVFVSNHLPTTV